MLKGKGTVMQKEPNAQNDQYTIMKILRISLVILVINCTFSYGQQSSHIFQTSDAAKYKYFILNTGDKRPVINKVEVSSTTDIDCNKKIFSAQLYNVMFPGGRLVLFSVLPSPVDGKVHWLKADISELKSNTISPIELDNLSSANLKMFYRSSYTNLSLVKLTNIKIIIKKGNEYYLHDTDCLTELFINNTFRPNSGFSNQNPCTQIDTSIIPLSISQFEKQYQSKNDGEYSYNNPGAENTLGGIGFKTPLLMYSHSGMLQKTPVQYFWTLNGWSADGLNLERGIDRFVFAPGIGIVGGDYTFYFNQIFRTYQSADCEKLKLARYLNNEMQLMPVKVTVDVQKDL